MPLFSHASSSPPGGDAIFGNGKDGSFDLDGANTYASFFTKAGNVYTQIGDIDGGIDITIRSGVTWKPAGWRARGTGVATFKSGALYDRSGTNASSNAGAVAPAAGANLFTSTNGGAGGIAAGSPGTANAQALGGSGGVGGSGLGGAGGAGGAATNTAAGTVGCDASAWPEAWLGITNKLAAWAGFVG